MFFNFIVFSLSFLNSLGEITGMTSIAQTVQVWFVYELIIKKHFYYKWESYKFAGYFLFPIKNILHIGTFTTLQPRFFHCSIRLVCEIILLNWINVPITFFVIMGKLQIPKLFSCSYLNDFLSDNTIVRGDHVYVIQLIIFL